MLASKLNQLSLCLGGENYHLLNARSRTLLKLGLNENALLDAVRVVQIKPKWSKVRFFIHVMYSFVRHVVIITSNSLGTFHPRHGVVFSGEVSRSVIRVFIERSARRKPAKTPITN